MDPEILDCIIVGYNSLDLNNKMMEWEKGKGISGMYMGSKHRSVRFDNKWMTYQEFIDIILEKATGKNWEVNSENLPSLAPFYLKSFLHRKNLYAEIINVYHKEKAQFESLLQRNPMSIAITTTFYFEPDPIIEIVQFVRQVNPNTKIIVGGPFISSVCSVGNPLYQDHILNLIGADIYIHDSQGELTLSRVLHELRKQGEAEINGISNLIFKNSDGAARAGNTPVFQATQRVPEENDLDENPVDWNLFPQKLYAPTAQMRTARGCAFNCSFCSYPYFAGRLALMRIDVIETEMKQLHDAGVKTLIIADDTFNIPLSRFKDIMKMMIANDFNFNWFSFLRCAETDDEAFDLMRRSGCKCVFLGIESGASSILGNMKKRASVDRYKYGIQALKARDIETYASFIIGFPGETDETAHASFDFIRETMPGFYSLSLFCYLHHSPIHEQAARFGLQGRAYTWKHDTMDWQKACGLIAAGAESIGQETILCVPSFTIWEIGYLHGLGIPMTDIKEFLGSLRPIILNNLSVSDSQNWEDHLPLDRLLNLGRKLTGNIQPR